MTAADSRDVLQSQNLGARKNHARRFAQAPRTHFRQSLFDFFETFFVERSTVKVRPALAEFGEFVEEAGQEYRFTVTATADDAEWDRRVFVIVLCIQHRHANLATGCVG